MTNTSKARADARAKAGQGGRRRKAPETLAAQNESRPPAEAASAQPKGKVWLLVELLQTPEGATIEAMTTATGWQAHSVRGALSGAIKKGLGVVVVSDKTDGVRRYRIAPEAGA